MATFIKVNLFILSIILFEFAWLYAAKADETIDYECPSVPVAALNSGYSVEAADKNLWKLSTEDDGVFYIAVNTKFCTYEMSAKVSDSYENLNELINTWHKNKMMGTIYKDDQGYIFKHFAALPNASEQLLEINIGLFDTGASNLLDSIDDYFKEISLENEEEERQGIWFKAYIEACFHAEKECEQYEDMYGPYQTRAECFERTKKMISGVREVLGDGEFDYKCVQLEHSV